MVTCARMVAVDEKLSASGYMLRKEPRGSDDGLYIQCERKKRVKCDPTV